jgi:biopolymer transport protein ExbD
MRKTKPARLMGDINMVPFIDITLILLIIFMVMTPFISQSQLKVSLPASSSVNTVPEDNLIRVEIDKSGGLSIMGKQVPFERLESELVKRMGRAHEKTILVQSDKDVSVQRVVAVFDAAKKLGAVKLGIGVIEKR